MAWGDSCLSTSIFKSDIENYKDDFKISIKGIFSEISVYLFIEGYGVILNNLQLVFLQITFILTFHNPNRIIILSDNIYFL